MRIAIDARELVGRPTGVGRYLLELLTEWAASADARRHEFVLYAHDQPAWLPDTFRQAVRVLPGTGGTMWEQHVLARAIRAERPGVLFAPGYTAPLTATAPVVVAVHDVSFLAHPEWFSRRESTRRRFVTGWSVRRARRVLTISRFSRREIVRYLRVPDARIQVIYPGIRPPARTPSCSPREPLVLHVGSLFQRRHVDVLIEAFARLKTLVPAARLEIVGENRTRPHMDFAAQVARLGLEGAVVLRSYVEEPVLAGLYARASVLAFLSEYEGFGLTPLEALAAGVAPVVLDTPVAREVLGEAARFVPAPATTELVASQLTELLTDEAARGALLDEGEPVLARYRWHEAARATLRVLEEAAGA